MSTNKEGLWDLSVFYESKDDSQIEKDFLALEETIKNSQKLFKEDETSLEDILEAIHITEKVALYARRLGSFFSLSFNADTSQTWATARSNRLRSLLANYEAFDVDFKNRIASISPTDFESDSRFEDYIFALNEARQEAVHLLDAESETLIANLNIYGGSAWQNLFDKLSSTATIDFYGEQKNLTEIRNLAYVPERELRYEGYEAELSMYPSIDTALASALTSIKGQVHFLAKKRGYTSALDEALDKSRMSKQTLEALISAMKDKKEVFEKYFQAKARYFGDNQLHWADMFAPIGELPSGYSVEDAQDMLVSSFSKLHQPLADIISASFENEWIDFYPRKGKVGGAFCSNQPQIKQSLILSNFEGSFSDVNTLAHELGHAYHGYCIQNHKPMNWGYSMPVAETASTFNETHFILDALSKNDSKEIKIGLLDSFLMSTGQVINDILSRFLFEDEVFKRVGQEMLSVDDLKDIMHRAQVEAYGDGLQEDSLHPYMWACKGHYYSTGLSYYNFPYAFGAIFAMALYAKQEVEGPSFMKKYDAMLAATTISSVEEIGQLVGFDFTQKQTWLDGLEAFEPYVDEFVDLIDNRKRN